MEEVLKQGQICFMIKRIVPMLEKRVPISACPKTICPMRQSVNQQPLGNVCFERNEVFDEVWSRQLLR